MAATYSVLYQYPTIENLGGSQTRPVMAVGYLLAPVPVRIEVRIPQTIYSPEVVAEYGVGYSGTIQAIMALPGVAGAAFTQTPQLDSTLLDELIIGVTSASGDSANTVTVPFSQLAPELVAPIVKKAVAALDAAEAL